MESGKVGSPNNNTTAMETGMISRRNQFRSGVLLAGALFLALWSCSIRIPREDRVTYDIVMRGGQVLDGTGDPGYRADVAITGDRIVAIGDLAGAGAKQTLDASGLHVAPGFIDAHTHAGTGLVAPYGSPAELLLLQGVTTVVINPDGGGPVDLARQREALLAEGLGVNAAPLIGHGSIRSAVIGMEDRAPTAEELEEMKGLVRAAMEDGAYGLSSGPFYTPGCFAETKEIIEVARVATRYGGIHQSHIRDESDYTIGLLASVDELIEVSRQAHLPGIVTHIKALGPNVWGLSRSVVERIEAARAEGLEIYADQYPYDASSTGLDAALLPRWASAGGRRQLLERLEDPATFARIRSDMLDNLQRRGGAERIVFSSFSPDSTLEGMNLREVAVKMGMEPVDAAVEVIRRGSASIISFNMQEADIETFMARPWTMTCTDGTVPRFGVGMPHPRSYGTFPRKIRKYVLEEGVLSLEAAVRSMTGLTATVFGLHDRGFVREGAFADIVVFDLERLRDTATYENPHSYAEGVVHVIVNGVQAVAGGEITGELAGRVLSKR